MEIELSKNDRAVANAAAKEDGRLTLNTLHIGNGEVAAANGFLLAMRKVAGIKKRDDVMVPADRILKVKNVSKALPKAILYMPGGNGGKPGSLVGEDGIKSSLERVEGTFPAYRQLLPDKKKKVKARISLAPMYLRQILAIAGRDATRIDFDIYEPTEPVAFGCITGDEHETHGLLMPMFAGK